MLTTPYVHLKNVLAGEDIAWLKTACKRILKQEGTPCFALIDHLESPAYQKIKSVVEEQLGEPQYYLNDFYIYTDKWSKAGWHMDTELFSFESAVNAWILLSPDAVTSPLGFIHNINDTPERSYHHVTIKGESCVFGNYCNGNSEERSLKLIESTQLHAPDISVGDILLINPKLFHKTNVATAKHGFAIKFVSKGPHGFLSKNQVDPHLWPEVALFNALVKEGESWENTISNIRRELKTPKGKKELSAGFFPERFVLYRKMVQAL